jgi:adhesin transport system outer membrane protein
MMRISLTKRMTCFILLSNILIISLSQASENKPIVSSKNEKGVDDILDSTLYSKAYKRPSKTSSTSLSQIVQEAVASHPSIDAEKEALSATDDVVSQAVAGYMPSIDLRASLGRENLRRSFGINTLSPLPSRGTITSTISDPSVTLRQILFDGQGTASRVSKAHSQRHQARGTLGVTVDTATIEAATTTIDVRRLQRLLQIVIQNIRFHLEMKKQVAEIVEAGAAPLSDLYQVEARLQDTYISRENIQSDLEVAIAKFIETVGRHPPDQIKRIKFSKNLIPESVEVAVRMALDNHNSIKVARSNVQIAESGNRETVSKLLPTVTFEASAERDRNMSGSSGYQNRLTAMVVARHNLFSGGADLAKSRETVKRLSEAHARLTVALRQTERTIRAAWGEARSARSKSAHLSKLIKEKRNIREVYLKEFVLGKRSLMDILDSANDVSITEATRTNADASTDINTVILLVGTGQFAKYLTKQEGEEIEDDDGYKFVSDPSDLPHCESDVQLTPFRAPLEKPLKPTTVKVEKQTPVKRKSMFQLRKEEREETRPEKEAA